MLKLGNKILTINQTIGRLPINQFIIASGGTFTVTQEGIGIVNNNIQYLIVAGGGNAGGNAGGDGFQGVVIIRYKFQ